MFCIFTSWITVQFSNFLRPEQNQLRFRRVKSYRLLCDRRIWTYNSIAGAFQPVNTFASVGPYTVPLGSGNIWKALSVIFFGIYIKRDNRHGRSAQNSIFRHGKDITSHFNPITAFVINNIYAVCIRNTSNGIGKTAVTVTELFRQINYRICLLYTSPSPRD